MNMYNMNESEISVVLNNSSNLGESIVNFKDILKPEMKKVKSKHILESYSQVIDEHENRKKFLLETAKKGRNNRIRNVDHQAKTILEYSFVQDHQGYQCETQNNSNYGQTNLKQNKSFYEKNIEEKIIKNQRLEEIRNKQRLEELSQLKTSPGMSQKSIRLLYQKGITRPLHQRYQEELEIKHIKRENLKQIYVNEDDLILLEKQSRSKSFNQKDFQDWVSLNDVREQKKRAKLEYMKQDIFERENEDEELSFNPKINKTSDMMVKIKKASEDPQISLYEKLHKRHEEKLQKIEKRKKQMAPDFTPKVNRCPSYIKNKNGPHTASMFFYEANDNKSQMTYGSKSPTCGLTAATSKVFKTKSDDKLSIQSLMKSPTYKSSDNLKRISEQVSTANGEQSRVEERKIQDSDGLYKLNVRSTSAWNKQVHNVKPYGRTNQIINSCVQYWK